MLGKNVPPAPIGFDASQEILWKSPYWRSDFRKRLAKKRWSIILNFLRINSVAILLSVLIARLIYLNTSVEISENSMMTLAVGIVTASAAILTIIVAFLIFWFGSSISSMQRIKSRIGDELVILEDIKEEIEPYTAGPKDTVEEPLRSKFIELSIKSRKFIDALLAISGRFHRAGSSTYYDTTSIYKLEAVIQYTGGNWFKDYVTIFPGHEAHDFARKTWIKALAVATRMSNMNIEAMLAGKQLDQVIQFLPLLTSVLLIFVFALLVSFISGASYDGGVEDVLLPITKLIMSVSLIVFLPVQLIGITKYIWSLLLSKYVGDETSRVYDENVSKNMETKFSFDYKAALKKQVDTISR